MDFSGGCRFSSSAHDDFAKRMYKEMNSNAAHEFISYMQAGAMVCKALSTQLFIKKIIYHLRGATESSPVYYL